MRISPVLRVKRGGNMIINPHANIVKHSQQAIEQALSSSPLGEEFAKIPHPITQFLARELAFVWTLHKSYRMFLLFKKLKKVR